MPGVGSGAGGRPGGCAPPRCRVRWVRREEESEGARARSRTRITGALPLSPRTSTTHWNSERSLGALLYGAHALLSFPPRGEPRGDVLLEGAGAALRRRSYYRRRSAAIDGDRRRSAAIPDDPRRAPTSLEVRERRGWTNLAPRLPRSAPLAIFPPGLAHQDVARLGSARLLRARAPTSPTGPPRLLVPQLR
jgi:hypothetical protein